MSKPGAKVEQRSPGPMGLRRSGVLAVGSIAVSMSITLFSVAATILILRFLPPDEAGKFAVLVELLYGFGILGSLGQPQLQARLYHQSPPGLFDWLADLRATIWIAIPVLGLGVLALVIPYRLTVFESGFLLVGALLFILLNCVSAVLTQQRHYAWGSALLRVPNGLLILPALLILVLPGSARLDLILVSLLLFLALTVAGGADLLRRRVTRGRAQMTLRQRCHGLVFVAANVALLIPQRGLIVVAGAMLAPEDVAALAALVVLLRVFDLIGDPAGRVFSTEMAQPSHRMSFGLFLAPWLLAGAISAVVLIAFPPLAHQFYAGRYDSALAFLPWLVAAGAFRFVEVVPRGVVAYLAPVRLLNWFSGLQCAIALAGFALMIQWTAARGFLGILHAYTLIAVARTIVSYVFLGKVLQFRNAAGRSVDAGEGLFVEPLEAGGQVPPV